MAIPATGTLLPQVSVHEMEGGQHRLVMKGAPEIVFKRCSTIMLDGEEVEIDDKIAEDYHNTCESLAAMGERVLAFVDLELSTGDFPTDFPFSTDEEEPNFPLTGLRLVGLMR